MSQEAWHLHARRRRGILNAGYGQALTASFTPTDAADYTGATAHATIDVAPAVPAISLTTGTFTYDGQPHAATATAIGINGEPLGPIVDRVRRKVDGSRERRHVCRRRVCRSLRQLPGSDLNRHADQQGVSPDPVVRPERPIPARQWRRWSPPILRG